MPVEQQDNTRVVQPPLIPPPSKEKKERMKQIKMQEAMQQNQAQLWDADKVKKYQNMQNFYNNNFWGYSTFGKQTNYDPRTSQGQAAIQSNFDYAKSNAQNFAENLVTAGISTKVTKVTTIPRSEMHLRNQVPGALKSNYIRTSNGLNTYTQSRVRILSEEQLEKVSKAIENLMSRKGWKRITHPNLEGLGFTNGKYVVSDLGKGNIGVDILGRPRLVDFVIETVPNFKLAMQRKGGVIVNIN